MNLKRFGAAAFAFMSIMCLFAVSAYAQSSNASADKADSVRAIMAFSAAIGLGLAAIGGALGQGKAAAAALEGIGRNPAAAKELLTPLLLSLAIIESLVIYSLVIAFMLVGKI